MSPPQHGIGGVAKMREVWQGEGGIHMQGEGESRSKREKGQARVIIAHTNEKLITLTADCAYCNNGGFVQGAAYSMGVSGRQAGPKKKDQIFHGP